MRRSLLNVVLGVFVAIALGLAGCGGGGGGGSSPASQSVSVVGTWNTGTLTLSFASNGSFTSVDNVNGINVTGTYSTNGNQLTITDTGGTSSCTAGQATGTYTYSVGGSGTTLTLTKVSDSCTGRTTAVDGRTFTIITASSIQGTWKTGTLTIVFNSNGSFTSVDNVNGINVVGTYSTNGSQLTITDTGGTSSCTAGQTTGTYTYALSGGGNNLTLTKTSDSCTGRTTAVNGKNFTRQ